jgi:hypothetical protein
MSLSYLVVAAAALQMPDNQEEIRKQNYNVVTSQPQDAREKKAEQTQPPATIQKEAPKSSQKPDTVPQTDPYNNSAVPVVGATRNKTVLAMPAQSNCSSPAQTVAYLEPRGYLHPTRT